MSKPHTLIPLRKFDKYSPGLLLSFGRSRKVYVLIAVNTVPFAVFAPNLRFPAALCGRRTAENRGLNRMSGKVVLVPTNTYTVQSKPSPDRPGSRQRHIGIDPAHSWSSSLVVSRTMMSHYLRCSAVICLSLQMLTSRRLNFVAH